MGFSLKKIVKGVTNGVKKVAKVALPVAGAAAGAMFVAGTLGASRTGVGPLAGPSAWLDGLFLGRESGQNSEQSTPEVQYDGMGNPLRPIILTGAAGTAAAAKGCGAASVVAVSAFDMIRPIIDHCIPLMM